MCWCAGKAALTRSASIVQQKRFAGEEEYHRAPPDIRIFLPTSRVLSSTVTWTQTHDFLIASCSHGHHPIMAANRMLSIDLPLRPQKQQRMLLSALQRRLQRLSQQVLSYDERS